MARTRRTMRRKNTLMDQRKLDAAKAALGASTDTAAIDAALDLILMVFHAARTFPPDIAPLARERCLVTAGRPRVAEWRPRVIVEGELGATVNPRPSDRPQHTLT